MACYKPIKAYATLSGGVVFDELRRHGETREIKIACGQCAGCRLERSRQWAVRITHEAALYDQNCFITLTYNNECLPRGNTLDHGHFQRFMRDLRKKHKVRFYMCGEYGDDYDRAHYHACIFGYDFSQDRYKWKKSNGYQLYRSPELEKLWRKGDSTIGQLNFETAAYTARYIMKKITGQEAEAHYQILDCETGEISERVPEYCRMSLKPGIGRNWLQLYWPDVKEGRVIINGKEATTPKYYRKYFKNSQWGKQIQWNLEELIHPEDNTPARLQIREQVTLARVNQFKRNVNK